MSQSNTEIVTGLYEAFGRGDIPAILAAFDENVVFKAPENLPHGGTFTGRDGAAQFFEGLGATWDGLSVDLGEVFAGGDKVVALVRIDGTLRATGEQTGYSSAHVWTVRDGVVMRNDEYTDAPTTLPTAAG